MGRLRGHYVYKLDIERKGGEHMIIMRRTDYIQFQNSCSSQIDKKRIAIKIMMS